MTGRARTLLAVVVLVATTFVWAPVASAEEPGQQGWWTKANPGSVMGAPVPPPAPDVPPDGLLVEGGEAFVPEQSGSGPLSYAALVYEVAAGSAVGPLVLKVAPGSGTSPTATLRLCPLTVQAFAPAQGGPAAEAPAYSCRVTVSAAPSSDGSSYSFNPSPLLAAGVLAVAVLPVGPTDRVVLAKPDAESLTVKAPAAGSFTSPGAGGSPEAGGTGIPGEGPAAGSSASDPFLGTTSPLTPPGGAAVVEPSVGPPPSASAPLAAGEPAVLASEVTEGSARPLAVALLLGAVVVGGVLWTAAGRAAERRAVSTA